MPSFAPLPKPADAALAERGLERWREHALRGTDTSLRAFMLGVADDPEGRALLDAVFGNSPYLSQSLAREPEVLRRVLAEGFDAVHADLLATAARECDDERDTGRLMKGLRQLKRRDALLIGLADIVGAWPLERVTAALCDIAETALGLAAAHLLRKAHDAGTLTLPDPARPAVGSGLIILGMGKLGARELNYSSDIDLIVLYDDGVVRTAQPDNLSRTFVRLTRELVRIMDERTADGYVFRTDLRLRPDPGATPLAVSVSAAELYYGSLGQNWERAAMIKARPVAGDPAAGRAMVAMLRSFVWRRHLDFNAIQDIHSIKRQINAHKGHKAVAINGHDVKLGRGGIREIEFFAQTQQLIFGGREPRLRASATCEALLALVAVGRIEARAAGELIAAYHFLRRVEHRIQMVEDQQTHKLPKTDAEVAALAVFLGYADADAFRADLLGHLSRVEDHYAALFEEAAPLSGPGNLVFTGSDDDPATIETLTGMGFANPGAVAAAVRGWHHGRYRSTRSTKARELLTELVPTLLAALGRTPQPDAALINFDAFLGGLPAGVQLFALFHANPNLLELVAEIMGGAPRLAETLSRHPARLDAVLTPGFFGPLPTAAELALDYRHALAAAEDFEEFLLASRRWTNDQKFRAGLHILRHVTDADHAGPFLADVADCVLLDALDRVAAELARQHGTFPGATLAIVALGKLGERQMSIGSDLDLIVVYDVPVGPIPSDGAQSDGTRPLSPPLYYTRLTQRLIGAITAQSAEGRLYEVDMRLRPSGNKGPLATSLESFVKYQTREAWTWEHMALTRARVLTRQAGFRASLETAIRKVLTRPRDPDTLLRDVADMRRRIDREFGTNSVWEVKYARGGLIDIEFVAQYLMLRHAHAQPEVLSANMAEALERLAAAGRLDPAVSAELVTILRMWRRVQGFLRLTTGGGFEPAKAPLALRAGLARAAFPEESAEPAATVVDFDAVETKVRAAAGRAFRHFEVLVDRPAAALPPLSEPETSTP